MHKNTMKCNKTLSKWCKNKHGASKIIDTFETYQAHVGGDNWVMVTRVNLTLPFGEEERESGRRADATTGESFSFDLAVAISFNNRLLWHLSL
jgi:hypothetical protein